MDVVIVEDERLSADKLTRMIAKFDPAIKVLATLDSVKSGTEWFRENSPPDLLFLDIQLSDGTGFDLLKEIECSPPTVFTTAYDQFAIKAFKFNSVDYLLKPLDQKELENALEKFLQSDSEHKSTPSSDFGRIDHIINGEFKKRFLVKIGEQYQSVDVTEIAYFKYDQGLTYIYTVDSKRWPVDQSLDNLENVLHPLEFFRVNRQMLVCLQAIHQIHTYFNSRLLLKVRPELDEDIIVSRDRVNEFKRWMDV